MPVIAIPIAAVAIGIAAESAITVGLTLTTVLLTTAAIGATVGAIGAVTQNKDLQLAGTIIGAVGGIAGLASSAGMFAAEGASLVADVGNVATDAGTWAGDVVAAAPPSDVMGAIANSGLPTAATGFDASALPATAAASDVPTGDIISQVVNQTTGEGAAATLPPGGNESIAPGSSGAQGDIPAVSDMVNAPQPTPAVANDGAATVPQAAPDVGAGNSGLEPGVTPPSTTAQPNIIGAQNDPANVSSVTNVPPDAAPGMINAQAPSPVTGTTNVPGQPISGVVAQPGQAVTGTVANPLDAGIPGSYAAAQKAVGVAGAAPLDGGSIWSDIMSTIGKPGVGTMLSGVMQAGGAFISGATSTLTPAQIKALNAQAEANQAASNLANQNAGLAAMRLKNFQEPIPVAVRTPKPPGMINQAPAVTGAPA